MASPPFTTSTTSPPTTTSTTSLLHHMVALWTHTAGQKLERMAENGSSHHLCQTWGGLQTSLNSASRELLATESHHFILWSQMLEQSRQSLKPKQDHGDAGRTHDVILLQDGHPGKSRAETQITFIMPPMTPDKPMQRNRQHRFRQNPKGKGCQGARSVVTNKQIVLGEPHHSDLLFGDQSNINHSFVLVLETSTKVEVHRNVHK